MKNRKQKALVKFYTSIIKAQPKRIVVILFKVDENVYDDLIVGNMSIKRFAKFCAWYHRKALHGQCSGYKPTIHLLTAKQYKRYCAPADVQKFALGDGQSKTFTIIEQTDLYVHTIGQHSLLN